jgi:hypothetical protein
MKERPIIFSNEMVQAILDGRKTQTRRVIKTTKKTEWLMAYNWTDEYIKNPDNYLVDDCPYGAPGDVLWVRETWADPCGAQIPAYKADNATAWENIKWRSPIHMPRWASRITLEITNVRVERVQEISFYELQQEGMQGEHTKAVKEYIRLWDSLNEKRGYPWSDNPWVWVIEFERLPQSPHEGLAQ